MSPALRQKQREAEAQLDADYVRSRLEYDPDTGVFRWKPRNDLGAPYWWNGKLAGKRAGYICKGHLVIRLDGRLYCAHRLAFLIMEGSWPAEFVNHADGNPANNRWNNLRPATLSQSTAARKNQWCMSASGVKGVRRNGKGWMAEIEPKGKRIYLGTFATIEEASAAYADAARQHFGDFARPS
jgi:HNH endonuclease/AP2 domain